MSEPTPSALASILAQAQTQWALLSNRDRGLIAAAGISLCGLLLWKVLVGPAWQTWRQVPQQIEQVQQQMLQMTRIASEARELKNQPSIGPGQAGEALKAATERLGGHGKLQLQGDRATLVLTATTAEQLRNWLGEARQAAHARPQELQLSRTAEGLSGRLVVTLPTAP